jgi:hypothetical protein
MQAERQRNPFLSGSLNAFMGKKKIRQELQFCWGFTGFAPWKRLIHSPFLSVRKSLCQKIKMFVTYSETSHTFRRDSTPLSLLKYK